jgi:WS/DGAT/MGAT family acyltransferase
MPRERDIDFADRMSEHEALMWNIEKDPWLNPSGAALTLLDVPVDPARFRRQVRYGISKVPRLYQRVVPGFGRISTPAWVPDAEFDLDYHIRELELPTPGSERQLMDLAAQLYAEPFDRTRPLWRFVLISGLEGGRGAIYSIFHHAISDGIGQIRMAELYQQMSRDEPEHPEIDLEGLIAEAVETHAAKESGGDLATSIVDTATRSLSHLARRQIGLGRRALGEIVLWPADTHRATSKVTNAVDVARSTVAQLNGSSNETPGGSPLWKQRSRHRHLEKLQIPLAPLKAAAKSQGATINDAFMAGLTDGAVRYHTERGAVVDKLNTSFVVSTRSDNKIGGNSFTPVLVQVSGTPTSPAHRIKGIHAATEAAREKASHGGSISSLSGIANLLPTSVVTKTARDQAARIDFATSNLRGAPFELFCAGAKVDATICMGPVAGTAANITALSYNGNLDLGLFIDPVAIEDPAGYRACVEAAFGDLLALAEEPVKNKRKTPKKTAPKKSAAKKATATKKTAPKKSAAKKTKKKATAKTAAD